MTGAASDRAVAGLEALRDEIIACRACPRLVAWREEVALTRRAAYRDQEYWGRPVPGFGDPAARVVVVGLAPAAHGGNRTGRVFTGDRSGDWLFASMYRTGFANQPTSVSADDGLALQEAYIAAAVRCAPPANAPTVAERDRCLPYLRRELALLEQARVVVALGQFAYDVMARMLGVRRRPRFGHLVQVPVPAGPESSGRITSILCSFHPSQQNTFTGRLTETMLDQVFLDARQLGGLDPLLAPHPSPLAPSPGSRLTAHGSRLTAPGSRLTALGRPGALLRYRVPAPMPELPEIEAYRLLAELRALDRRIVEVATPDAWYLKGGTDAASFREALVGASFRQARRRGKLLLLDLAPAGVLGIRFGMTGRLWVDNVAGVGELLYSTPREEPIYDRFGVTFADGGTMVVRDPRRLGGVQLDPVEDRLGPDARGVTLAGLRKALAGSSAPLKARLLDQARLAGVGNLLADEILWRSALSPLRPAGELSPAELRRLRTQLVGTVERSIERGGSHTGDLMIARRRGGLCPRDGTPLVRDQVGGRTTWWCPAHQR